jgi:large subunit ribosomal protein L25
MGKAVEALRAAGSIPAVVYGPKQESLSITLNSRDFEKVFKTAGESTVVTIAVDGQSIPTLIHEVDRDPVSDMVRHADFYAIVKGQKVKVMIPLEFVGDSAAVKEGANLVKTMFEIEVEADPMNLPHELTVDISKLAVIGDQVLASDIALPAGVVLAADPEEVVAIAAAAVEEELEAPVTGPDMTAIGISEERGKKEEEAEPAAE